MRQKLLIVEDHFQITGRGLVVVGKVEKNSPIIKIEDSLIVISEDNKIKTKLAGFEMPGPPNFNSLGILLPELTKDDVPIGSDIFVDT